MTYNNQKEIVFFGIRRSGNHAVIKWILQNIGSNGVHLNDITGENPYDSCTKIYLHNMPVANMFPEYANRSTLPFDKDNCFLFHNYEDDVDWGKWKTLKEEKKDTLIISYEDRSIKAKIFSSFLQQHDAFVGESNERYLVILLRDAYNLFASMYKAAYINQQHIDRGKQLFKEYAEIFLAPKVQRESKLICINFNGWHSNKQYRILLGELFGVTLNGDPFREVSMIGGGSSFDGTSLNQNAQHMKVLERWKEYASDPEYRAIFDDKELVELSNAIFGRIVPQNW